MLGKNHGKIDMKLLKQFDEYNEFTKITTQNKTDDESNMEYNVGASNQQVYEIKKIDNDYFEEE